MIIQGWCESIFLSINLKLSLNFLNLGPMLKEIVDKSLKVWEEFEENLFQAILKLLQRQGHKKGSLLSLTNWHCQVKKSQQCVDGSKHVESQRFVVNTTVYLLNRSSTTVVQHMILWSMVPMKTKGWPP